ncbi:phosphatidate cytidylyltransferase [Candidatus Fermentibacteria bacterium]|nr:phosphatidate cytidylyltransferase [Candidatus Fermentibacteria bacterium]
MSVSNLLTRSAVAAVFIPAYLFLVLHGGWALLAVNCAIMLIAAWEFCRLGLSGFHLEVPATLLACAVSFFLIAAGRPGPAASVAVLPFLFVVAIDIASGGPRETLARASRASAAVLYVAWLFGHVHLLRLPSPAVASWPLPAWKLALVPFYLTWIVDTAAYGIGSALGRHRMAPAISPRKSWEGAAAGLVAGLAAGAALRFLGPLPLPVGLLLGGLAGTLGQGADLAESLFKREAGVKDSSRLIPGHGGVLDRFDSLLVNIPATYYSLVLLAPGRP